MCQSSRPRPALTPTRLLGGAGARLVVGLLIAQGGLAHAQMVPRGEHLLRQTDSGFGAPSHATSGSITTARVHWDGSPATDDAPGQGLALKGRGPWPRWEGRIGAVIDRPMNPVRDNFVLAQPAQHGLRMRSLHLLSDYYMEGGFRATLGLVSGETGQAWWSSGDTGGGLNLSLQQLDNLGTPLSRPRRSGLTQPNPYLGAGYSSRAATAGQAGSWRFNADLGLVNVNGGGDGSAERLGDVLQGQRPLGDLVNNLRLRPVVKVSVGYAF
ncbi:MAG: hypothetical protein I8H76_09850 [Burkholderiales bacterium]|nr:hypothetical protein [Burkholderiales bacterium]MBH2017775.1 hypothetical protein [Burkholderiales bacterium]